MGNLFPDDDEYPNHRPIPTSWPSPRGTAIVAMVGIAVTANDLAPWSNPQEDPPHREYLQVRARHAMSALGSTSGNLSWLGNSTDAADTVIGRRWSVSLDAVPAITASSAFVGPTS
jgi:hypothetical protein